MRRNVPALILAAVIAVASAASAQDRDAFDAVLDAQRLRAKQMDQVNAAPARAMEPLERAPVAPPPPAAAPSDERPRVGSFLSKWAPWIVPATALAAILVLVLLGRGASDEAPVKPGRRPR